MSKVLSEHALFTSLQVTQVIQVIQASVQVLQVIQ